MPVCPLCSGPHSIDRCPRWRVPTVLSVLALTMFAPVAALEVDGNKMTMTPQEVVLCAGGCTLVTNRSLAEMRRVLQLLIDEVEARKTCRRGDFNI